MHATLFVLAWLSATVPALLGASGDASQQPLLPTSTPANFSVGFSLQSSFGAAAVIFENYNGDLETHTRVCHGDKAYQEVMARLSLASSRHLAPPYEDMGEYFDDLPRREVRNGLTKVGLPASHDVGILAGVVKQLRSDFESEYHIRVSEAVFTSTHLLALYQDDLMDLADHLGIKYVIPKRQFKPILWETASSYAGYGLGLCEHWRDEDRCTEETHSLPKINLLSVHYSRTALTTALVPIKTAVGAFEPDPLHIENFTLGSDAIGDYPNPEDYWTGVKDVLLNALRRFPGYEGPHKIMMTGDMAQNEDFMKFVKDTIEQHRGLAPPIIYEDALTAAAKGAAELMRRGPAPWS
ncbi:hypothetical protein F5Y05DRAFT_222803 [Hypoxylon sp. FL0543]|nr:hypothetical protein F5Y05DRAFT_222803 [Hypoxylon sp. FL0543]